MQIQKTRFFLFFVMSLALLIAVFMYREYHKVISIKADSWTTDVVGDCAVVLTGGRGRVKEGFSLLSRGAIRKLIISGVYEKAQLRDLYPEIIFNSTIEPNDILLEKHSQTTYGNALQTRTLVDALKCRDLILITSQTHMYRAYKTFRSHFPREFLISKRAIVAGSHEHEWSEALEEAMKSIFYSSWTY